MVKLIAIIEKNFRQLIHSKSSALIIIIGPIILMALAGLALSSSGLFGINVGVYAPDANEFKDVLDEKLKERSFAVTYFPTIDACKESVIHEETHICVEVGKKEDQDLAKIDARLANKVNFYVDYSKIRLVWALINSIRTIVDQESAKITTDMTNRISLRMEQAISMIESEETVFDDAITTLRLASGKTDFIHDRVNSMGSQLSNKEALFNGIKNSATFISTELDSLSTELTTFGDNINAMITFIPAPHNANLQSDFNSFQTKFIESNNEIDESIAVIKDYTGILNVAINSAEETRQSILPGLFSIRTQLNSIEEKLSNLQEEVKEITKELEWARSIKATDLIEPIPVEIRPVKGDVIAVGSVSKALTYLDYLLPALLILVVMFVSTLLTSTMTIKERKSHAYFRNLISPTNKTLLMFGVCFISLILVSIQIALLTGVAALFFGVTVTSPLAVVVIMLLTMGIFIVLGCIIGYLFNSEETATVASISTSLVFLLFSALIIPLETMPTFMRKIAQFSPFVVSETSLRKTIIFNIPLRSMGKEMILLAVSLALLIGICLLVHFWKRKKEI